MFQYEGIQAFPFDPNRATALRSASSTSKHFLRAVLCRSTITCHLTNLFCSCSAQAVDILHSSTHILSCVPPADGTNTDPVSTHITMLLQVWSVQFPNTPISRKLLAIVLVQKYRINCPVYVQVLATVGSELQNCASVLGVAKWVGYLSSTGVYGDWQGDWVDEE